MSDSTGREFGTDRRPPPSGGVESPTVLRAVRPEEFRWGDYRRYTFSLGVRVGDEIVLSGMTAATFDQERRQTILPNGTSEQTEVVLDKIQAVLAAEDVLASDVVEVVEYVVADVVDDHALVAAVRDRHLSGAATSVRSVCVDRLLRPDATVEIAVVAHAGPLAPTPTRSMTISPRASRGESFRHQVAEVLDLAEQALEEDGSDWSYVAFAIEQLATGTGPMPDSTVLDHVDRIGHERLAGARFGTRRLMQSGDLVQLDLRIAREPVEVIGHEARFDGPATLTAATRTRDHIFLSGQTAGRPAAAGGIRSESEDAHQRLLAALGGAGGDVGSLLETVEHVTLPGLDGYAETAEVRRALLPSPFTAATGTVGGDRSFLIYGTARVG
jgi:enamine deaminase RidA (YjgF/YER057c/UK114 family)